MDAHRYNRLTIELHNDETDTMREILRLAHERLINAPRIQLKGSPLERQAGLLGPELFRAKDMLEKLGKIVGIELPIDASPDNEEVECVHVISGSIFTGSHEEIAAAIAKTLANAWFRGAKL